MDIDKNLLNLAKTLNEDRIKKTFSSVISSSDGKNEYKINTKILENNQVPKENLPKIADIYQKIEKLFKKSKKANNNTLEKIIFEMKELEYELQGLWNFEKDDNFHKYWTQIKIKEK